MVTKQTCMMVSLGVWLGCQQVHEKGLKSVAESFSSFSWLEACLSRAVRRKNLPKLVVSLDASHASLPLPASDVIRVLLLLS